MESDFAPIASCHNILSSQPIPLLWYAVIHPIQGGTMPWADIAIAVGTIIVLIAQEAKK